VGGNTGGDNLTAVSVVTGQSGGSGRWTGLVAFLVVVAAVLACAFVGMTATNEQDNRSTERANATANAQAYQAEATIFAREAEVTATAQAVEIDVTATAQAHANELEEQALYVQELQAQTALEDERADTYVVMSQADLLQYMVEQNEATLQRLLDDKYGPVIQAVDTPEPTFQQAIDTGLNYFVRVMWILVALAVIAAVGVEMWLRYSRQAQAVEAELEDVR